MKTSLPSLELSDEQRRALHVHLTGKNGLATREMVADWAMKTLKARLARPEGEQTRLVSMACPRCQRPISVPVPVVAGQNGGDQKPAELGPRVAPVAAAAKADVDRLVASLGKLADALGGQL
jgi:hypothetical protein